MRTSRTSDHEQHGHTVPDAGVRDAKSAAIDHPADVHSGHAGQGADEHGAHDKHAGHSVEMFRKKFWGTFLLSIPTIIWAPMIQHWFGYEAPGGAVASRWVPAIFGTGVFGYGGLVFIKGAIGELRDRET